MLFSPQGQAECFEGMYNGSAGFLICSGPSLTSHNLAWLHRPGIVTLAVNNAATIVRPNLWTCVDDPGNFCDVIWRDPGILKFVPMAHMKKRFMVRDNTEQLVPSQECVGDMPTVFGFHRNETFDVDRWLHEDTINWGNHSKTVDSDGNKGSRSVMYVALRLLFHLGVRTVYLLGCDFRMQVGKRNYAFPQDRTPASVRGNNSSYQILNSRLQRLKPHFEQADFRIYNCTPNSGLSVFPFLEYEEAVERATAQIPKKVVTEGMYDRNARERKGPTKRKAHATGVANNRPAEPCVPEGDVPDFSVVIPICREDVPKLHYTWQTWLQFHPILRQRPLIVLHDSRISRRELLPESCRTHSQLSCIPVRIESRQPVGLQWLDALIRLPAERVRTPWYLKLDPDAIAQGDAVWPLGSWFQPSELGREPVLIGSCWGYTKPASALSRLDDWGDTVAPLKHHRRLNLPFDPHADRIKHDTLSSWCCFINTAWTRSLAGLLEENPPVTDHARVLCYVATRQEEPVVRIQMKQHGWDHSFSRGPAAIQRECRKLLGESRQLELRQV